MFQLFRERKKGGDKDNSYLGIILLLLSLTMDGVCGLQQDVVVPRYKPTPLHLQVMLNSFGVVVSLVTALLYGELGTGIRFLINNKACLMVSRRVSQCTGERVNG